jgi:hypothetical protein
MRKKMIDQNTEPAIVAIASGYTMNTKPGPATAVHTLTAHVQCYDSFVSLDLEINVFVQVCGLVVRVPGYKAEIYCASCEVRTECIYVM